MLEGIIAAVKALLAQNQFAMGGILLAALGGLGVALKKAWDVAYFHGHGLIFTTLEINSTDRAFDWLRVWLHAHPYSQKNRNLLLATKVDTDLEDSSAFNRYPKMLFLPAPGVHFFFYRGRFMWIDFTREKNQMSGKGGSGGGAGIFHETVTITTIGDGRSLFKDIVVEAHEKYSSSGIGKVKVYFQKWEGWKVADVKEPRSAASIISEEGIAQAIVADARMFREDKDWYRKHEVPWKRGYLLYGEPGNGKSSIIHAVASELGSNIYFLSLTDQELGEGKLVQLMSEVPPGDILVIEEIDTVMPSRDEEDDEEDKKKAKDDDDDDDWMDNQPKSMISLGSLLNALDGITSGEGRILFMTTNFPEKLDKALKRPGRVDRTFELKNASKWEAIAMFERFFPDMSEGDSLHVGYSVPDGLLSKAELQEHLISNRRDMRRAVDTIGELVLAKMEEQSEQDE